MSYSNGIITAPVSIYDVQRALGASSPDLGTLCKHSSINMFAKYKPVRLASANTFAQWDATNNTWKNTATWWKGTSENCGVTFTGYGSFASAKSAIDNGATIWQIELPTGGSSQPFRLTDFAEYNHTANPSGRVSALDLYKSSSSYTIYLMPEDSDRALSFDDITYYNASTNPRLSTFYFTAVFVKKSDSSVVYGYSSASTLGNGGYSIEIPQSVYNPAITANGWQTGEYYVYCFFTSGKYQDGSIGSWIPLPGDRPSSATSDARKGLSPIEIEIKASTNYLKGSATVVSTGSGYRIDWRIEEHGDLRNKDCTLKVYANSEQEGSARTITSWTTQSGEDYVYHNSTALEGIIMAEGKSYRLEFSLTYNYVEYKDVVYVLNPY